jgi:SagB-type dehydrogenase family enzyme
VREAPINIVIAAVYERTTNRYGERGIRYVHMEAGHVGQNLYLQAVARGLGMVVVGAFYDDQVQGLPAVANRSRAALHNPNWPS